MFRSISENKRLQSEIDFFKAKYMKVKQENQEMENRMKDFLHSLYRDLLSIVNQHEVVNGQHHDLA
ncbi:hypothetical protein M3175_17520 [Robertmurraya korlensis]|uniref:hypothetical protein n=1 Tax=Robertmurraya korlensis TaxID=519977 RepID=UPI00203D97C9|nr:hypothetical protein [Robertmurraya korlensis]MCM3602534.1 hypothetical protein [Robertmurraya korlensis]